MTLIIQGDIHSEVVQLARESLKSTEKVKELAGPIIDGLKKDFPEFDYTNIQKCLDDMSKTEEIFKTIVKDHAYSKAMEVVIPKPIK